MGFTTPRDWTVGEIVTEAMMDTHIKDNLRYLKGLDGVVTTQAGLIISNVLGTEYLTIPSLTATQRDALTPTAGMLIYNSSTTKFNKYENGAWRADLAYNGDISLLQIASQAQGDILHRGASTWERLPKGTTLQHLRMNVGATDVEWAATDATKQFHVPCFTGNGGALSAGYGAYYLNSAVDYASMTFRIPNDFVSLTTIKIIIMPITTGTFDWTASTTFGANGEAYNVHTDSATADGQVSTDYQFLELDISAAFTGITANDIINLIFTCDVLTTTTYLYVMGLDVKYT